jgi:hypothetical protein
VPWRCQGGEPVRRRGKNALPAVERGMTGSSIEQLLEGGNQLYSSNYAIKDGEFLGVNRQAPVKVR